MATIISHNHLVHVEIVLILVFQTFDRVIFGRLSFPGTRWYVPTVRGPQVVRDQKKLGNHRRRPQKFFQGEQHRHFAYLFQIADGALQMDVNKTLYPFYTPKYNAPCLCASEGGMRRPRSPWDVEIFLLHLQQKRLIF